MVMELEEIIRDRIILELEDLKNELTKEEKRRRVEGKITDDIYLKYKWFSEADGMKEVIKRIERRILEKRKIK